MTSSLMVNFLSFCFQSFTYIIFVFQFPISSCILVFVRFGYEFRRISLTETLHWFIEHSLDRPIACR